MKGFIIKPVIGQINDNDITTLTPANHNIFK